MLRDFTALIVDDYEVMRQHLSKTLEPFGITLFEASNGLEALEIVRREKVDVIFTDIVMPMMDGFELCDEVRRSADIGNIPIVVLSTHCDSHYIIKALHLGASDYIPKPANPETVKKVLSRILIPTIPKELCEQKR